MISAARNHLASALAAALAVGAAVSATPALADGIIEDPLPRVADPLCPGIIGLDVAMAEGIISRIRANAQSFGVPLADEATCDPNLVVAIVTDGQAWLADLANRRGYLFRDMDRVDREELLATTGPVRAWNQVVVRTRDGMQVGLRENLTSLPTAGGWQAHSRIYRPVRKDITYSLVLFDREGAANLSPAQLADYATVRALSAELPEIGAVPGPTILGLFSAGSERVAGLTSHDREWLDRLYSGPANTVGSVARRALEQGGG